MCMNFRSIHVKIQVSGKLVIDTGEGDGCTRGDLRLPGVFASSRAPAMCGKSLMFLDPKVTRLHKRHENCTKVCLCHSYYIAKIVLQEMNKAK